MRLEFGQPEFRKLYESMGELLHPGGMKIEQIDEVIEEALRLSKLPARIAASGNDTALDSEVIYEHEAAISLVGDDVGTPVISVNGAAFFGPVVTPAPKGQEALDLWDGALLVSRVSGFYEIKRDRKSTRLNSSH